MLYAMAHGWKIEVTRSAAERLLDRPPQSLFRSWRASNSWSGAMMPEEE